MRLMAITECRPGDIAADVIRNQEGSVLADRKDVLTDDMIARMHDAGLDVVPIDWPGWEMVRPAWWLADPLVRPLQTWAEKGLAALDGDGITQARRLSQEVILRFSMGERRPFEWIPRYLCGNPALTAWINTIGLTIKLTQGFDVKWVDDYALAAVLLGLEMPIATKAVNAISNVRLASLTNRVRTLSSIPATTRAAVSQHHARWDGSGDPPLKGEKIYNGARVVGMAEFINVLLFRTDEPALPVNEALEWVVGGAGIDFPLDLVRLLQRTVAPYPVGTVVQLGHDELGVVLDNPHDWPARPMIRLLNGKDAGTSIHLKEPHQHVRVITGFYNGRDIPS
ncbi:MAG: phosphohydrolase [Sulfobacillus acidophilus]|uniref:Phosphohydrolase n=1 Tax=Sulfobacillus acidophilus TaxID=53633 RepID=A0A2T2WKK5_9FIRM|nr:MAG: phosphohydrolase [Sulfobacillus acidophilus]